jgi:hypothetical protein
VHLSIAMATKASGGRAVFIDEVSAIVIWVLTLLAARSKLRESAFTGPVLMEAKLMPTNTELSLGIIGATAVIESFTTSILSTSSAVLVDQSLCSYLSFQSLSSSFF